MSSWLLLFLLMSAWKGPQPSPEMVRLKQALERMGENLERLPNYTCLETIDRSIRQTAKDKLLVRDRIHLQVAFIGFEEVFAWPGSANFEPRAAIQIAPGGAGGIGSWGGWSRNVLRSSAPAFTYAGECTVEGRRGMRYDFHVPWASSAYTVGAGNRQLVVPYAGTFCIDPGSLDIMRLEMRAEVAHLPFAAVSETIDYGRVRIGAADFLLPQSHTLAITDLEGHEGRNVTTLSACRQYAADSAEPVPQQKAEEPQLPAGIYLNLKLETRITFDQSAVGDPVSARLDRAFRATGISVPKGALVSGHIRRIEERYQPEKHYLVGLDFSTLSFADTHLSFRAHLVGPQLRFERRPDSVTNLNNAPIIDVTGLEIDDSNPLSPFGVFRVRTGRLDLARGLPMIWQTQGRE